MNHLQASKPKIVLARRNQRRPSGIGLVAVMAVLLTAAMLAAWWQRQPAAEGLAHESGFLQDAERLWGWSDDALEGGAEAAAWTARWNAAMPSEAAAVLADKLRLTTALAEGRERQEENYRLLLWTGAEPSESVVLLLEGRRGMDKGAFFALLENAGAALAETAERFDAGLTFRADSARADSADRIARSAEAVEVERYEDGGTTSVTYYSGQLTGFANSREQAVNLQLAARRDDVRKRWLVTGGTPLITGEYSMQ
jgi:hypothetical protein